MRLRNSPLACVAITRYTHQPFLFLPQFRRNPNYWSENCSQNCSTVSFASLASSNWHFLSWNWNSAINQYASSVATYSAEYCWTTVRTVWTSLYSDDDQVLALGGLLRRRSFLLSSSDGTALRVCGLAARAYQHSNTPLCCIRAVLYTGSITTTTSFRLRPINAVAV